jgi:hypothetical protein
VNDDLLTGVNDDSLGGLTDPEAFCRAVEGYLCRKNDGHLIRIVGPAFEQVCGWASQGIPIKVVQRGIDRYFERYYAKGPRRRPVRVEFCEADVFDVFDEWKRAVGVGRHAPDTTEEDGAARKHGTLPAHLERVVARLTTLRGGEDRRLDAVLDEIVREVDAARSSSKGVRGEARTALLDRLRALDAGLLRAAREVCDAPTLQRLDGDAERELAPFRQRMAADAYTQSKQLCVDRLIREHLHLPTIAFD